MKPYSKLANILMTVITLQASTALAFGIGALSGEQEYGHPVHEEITRKAALDSKYLTGNETEKLTQLVEGVRYNDDPKSYISGGNLLGFAFKFLGSNTSKKDATEAFHFGDYQFMHAMANSGIPAYKVQNHMMVYAYHCWLSATQPDSFEKFKITYKNIKEKLKNNSANSEYTREELVMKDMVDRFSRKVLFYNADNQLSFQQRALGSLLHMVQDSYAKGHTVREGWKTGENEGDILYFQAYEEQDSHQHKHYDVPKSGHVSEQSIFEIPGSKMAYLRSKQILEMAANKCPWSKVDLRDNDACKTSMYSFFNDEVFALSSKAQVEVKNSHSHEELLKPEPIQNPEAPNYYSP